MTTTALPAPTPSSRESRTPSQTCTTWCIAEHASDPACWGDGRPVNLTLEEGYPADALPERVDELDPPRLDPHPYRHDGWHREVIYLHIYRPSRNEHLDLDTNVHLTADEARQLAAHLLAVADEIGTASR